jgi:hypothetical protein
MNTIAKWLTTLALTAGPMAANATLTFNYADDYAYDSSTGLYWQIEAVPTSTFVPSGGGQFATGAQVGQLINDVGASSFSGAAPYSVQIANLLSFFTADRPAPRDSGTIPAENYVLPWTAFVDSYGSPDTGHNFNTASNQRIPRIRDCPSATPCIRVAFAIGPERTRRHAASADRI